jgi:hypothetical protein
MNLELNRPYNAANSGLSAQLWVTASNSESAFFYQGQYAASTLISASQFRGYNHRTAYLDGVNDYFSSSANLSGSGMNPAYTSSFSINFWIRQEAIDVLPGTSFQPTLVSSGRPGNFGAAYFSLFYEGTLSGGVKSNVLIARLIGTAFATSRVDRRWNLTNSGNSTITGITTSSDGWGLTRVPGWVNLHLVYNGASTVPNGNFRLWWNGQELTQTQNNNAGTSLTFTYDGTERFIVGQAINNLGGTPWGGPIDSLCYWPSVQLTASSIPDAIYNRGCPHDPREASNLTTGSWAQYYRFSLNGNSDNGNDGKTNTYPTGKNLVAVNGATYLTRVPTSSFCSGAISPPPGPDYDYYTFYDPAVQPPEYVALHINTVEDACVYYSLAGTTDLYYNIGTGNGTYASPVLNDDLFTDTGGVTAYNGGNLYLIGVGDTYWYQLSGAGNVDALDDCSLTINNAAEADYIQYDSTFTGVDGPDACLNGNSPNDTQIYWNTGAAMVNAIPPASTTIPIYTDIDLTTAVSGVTDGWYKCFNQGGTGVTSDIAIYIRTNQIIDVYNC